jgi:PA domain
MIHRSIDRLHLTLLVPYPSYTSSVESMPVPSPNILLALFILSFSLSAIFHRSTTRATPSNPAPPNLFNHYAADILVPSTNDTFSSRPGAFGGLFEDVLRGELVTGWDDGLACHDICKAATDGVVDGVAEDQSVKFVDGDGDDMFGEGDGVDVDVDGLRKHPFRGKIVLVRRGKCSFADKVRRVQKEGGIAVIVGDNTPSSGLLTMYAKGDIPLTSLSFLHPSNIY